jgi:hypothetical protein
LKSTTEKLVDNAPLVSWEEFQTILKKVEVIWDLSSTEQLLEINSSGTEYLMSDAEEGTDESVFAPATDSLSSKLYLTPGPTPKIQAGLWSCKRKRLESPPETGNRPGKRRQRVFSACLTRIFEGSALQNTEVAQVISRTDKLDPSY